jgi:peptidoglycan hydrolase-like protein with peptidoglycan-binding domain
VASIRSISKGKTMKNKLGTLGTGCPTCWIVAATVLLLLVPSPAIAGSGPRATDERNAGSSWPSPRPTGWSAGSIARGTGSSLGASARVREVQRKLNRLGYRAGAVDGLFGPVTDEAVRRFQRDNALAVDGIVGPRTLRELRSRSKRLERLLSEGVGFRKPNGSVRVRSVQRKLNRLGYGAGKVDGLFGPRTDGAVRSFQAERGLQVDGIVGPQTLRRLGPRTEAAKEVARRPIEPLGRPKQQPAPDRPRRLDPRDAPLDAPWEGQPLLAQLATMVVLALIALLIVVAVALMIGRRSAASKTVVRGAAPDQRAGPASQGMSPGNVARERPPAIERVGARVLLSPEHWKARSADTVRVDLRLFVENEERHWEANLDDPRLTAVPIAPDELQEQVRQLVVPEGLPRVVAALKEQGVDVRSHHLEEVFFVVELARDVERELLKARPNGSS